MEKSKSKTIKSLNNLKELIEDLRGPVMSQEMPYSDWAVEFANWDVDEDFISAIEVAIKKLT